MDTKDCLLVSGASAFLLASPAMATRPTEDLNPNQATPTFEEVPQLPETLPAQSLPDSAPLSAPESISPDFSTHLDDSHESLQVTSDVQVTDNWTTQTSPTVEQSLVETPASGTPETFPPDFSTHPDDSNESLQVTSDVQVTDNWTTQTSPTVEQSLVETPASGTPETFPPDFSRQTEELGKAPVTETSLTVKQSPGEASTIGSLETFSPNFSREAEDLGKALVPNSIPATITNDTSVEEITAEVVPVHTLANLAPGSANVSGQAGVERVESTFLDKTMDQVTPVWQLADVQPTDWSFQALQSLVERYGVIAGYPDGTFRGNRPLTRYEFAAALNALLDAINQKIGSGSGESLSQEDLVTLERLHTEFAAELTESRRQIESLETRTERLEAQQFSPTVKLGGQVILGVSTATGGDPPGRGETDTVLSHLSFLQLTSSFIDPKRDVLRVGFVAGNFGNRGFANPQALNTNMALLAYQADTNNRLELSSLEYRFAASNRLVFTFKPVGFSLNSVLNSNSPYVSAGQGALSRFAGASPIYKIGSLDTGGGLDFLLTNRARLQVAYGVRNANSSNGGLFSADHRALGVQLLATPANNLRTSIAYVNAFASDGRLDTFTGSNNADISGGFNEPATIHALNGTLAWRVTPKITLGAWGGATLSHSRRSDALALSTTYLFSLGISDPFGRKGDLLALMVGQPPRLRAGFRIVAADEGSSMHYEAFYRFRVNNRVSVTPGFFLVTNPGHISENNNIFVASLRTTFSF